MQPEPTEGRTHHVGWTTAATDILRFVVGAILFLFGLGFFIGGLVLLIFDVSGWSIGVHPLIEFFLGLVGITLGLMVIGSMSQAPIPTSRKSP